MEKEKKHFRRWWLGVVLAVWLCFSPVAFADGAGGQVVSLDANAAAAPVIITEVATGTKTSGSQEFIELYNTTAQPIDLAGWHLWYLSAQAADQNKPSADGVLMLGDNASSSVIAAHGYYVLSGRTDYLTATAQQFYTGTLAATGGNLRLLSPDNDDPCLLDEQDRLGWGNALYAQGQAAPAPPSGQSITRLLYADGVYIDMHDNAADFAVSATPSPGAINMQEAGTAAQAQAAVNAPNLPSVSITSCTPPSPSGTGTGDPLQQPTANDAPPAVITAQPPTTLSSSTIVSSPPAFPASDAGLVTPQITELLPNPAPPQTDADGEFIELYNSNDAPFDLSGFGLRAGLTAMHHYSFPPGTSLPPKSFTGFFSVQTGLTLSNAGGQVALLDPSGMVINQTEQYSAAKDGQAWTLADGSWYWSTTPTPNAANIVTAATASTAKKKPASNTAKKASGAKAAAAPKVKTTKAKTPISTMKSGASSGQSSSFHPAVLAIVAGFALLYGLYEYRQDVANQLYQFRANRAARRAARAEIEGG